MYEYINGTLVEITPTDAIVEAAGVGYDLIISLSTFSKLQGAVGKNVKVFTFHQVREDDESLFGFADKAERAVFTQLVSVSGVGPGSARMILSAMTAEEAKEAVVTGDIDLKDKIGKGGEALIFDGAVISPSSAIREEALGALTMLGFSKPAVEKTLDKLLKEKSDYTVEELIKRALKMM